MSPIGPINRRIRKKPATIRNIFDEIENNNNQSINFVQNNSQNPILLNNISPQVEIYVQNDLAANNFVPVNDITKISQNYSIQRNITHQIISAPIQYQLFQLTSEPPNDL